jgi:hypothetical protein
MGVFCNFADGLVFQDPEVRLALTVRSATYTLREITSATLTNIVAGDVAITGTGFDYAFYGHDHDPTGGLPVAPNLYDLYKATDSGNGWTLNHVYEYMGSNVYRDVTGLALNFFVDGADIFNSNIYSLNDLALTSARLSDYAYRDVNADKIYRLDYDASSVSGYKTLLVPTLNHLYEYNGFYRSDIPTGISYDNSASALPLTYVEGTLVTALYTANGYTAGHTYQRTSSMVTPYDDVTKVLLFNCNIELIGSNTALNLSTISVDTGFNGLKVNFDSVIEVETTPG